MAEDDKKRAPATNHDGSPEQGIKPDTAGGGEDESSTEHEGDDSHLHEDQKSRTQST